jgi:short-subunit dehydrogenase
MEKLILITGASSGLGEEFAFQLAEQGYSLLLVARRLQRLQDLQCKIVAKYPNIRVFCQRVDLSEQASGEQIFDYINQQKLALHGVVNNAGFGQRGRFSELPLSRQMAMLQVNINSLVCLTHLMVPLLKQHKDSFIINVASTAAFQAGPNLAIYYASKSFVLSFSQALYEELKAQGILVSALCPGATNTEFIALANMPQSRLFKLRVMETKPVVSYALAHRNKAVVIPGFINKISVFFVQIIPSSLARKLAYLIQK